MVNTVQSVVLDCLAAGGAPRLFHRLFRPGTASILMYHGVVWRPLALNDWCFVQEADFAAQMEYVARWFDVVPLAELGRQSFASRRPLAAITFDDGYMNNYETAWPILKRLWLPATIFLNTALVGGDDTVWFCRLNDALARTKQNSVTCEGEALALGSVEAREAAGERLQEILKALPQERMEAACAALIRSLGDDPRRPLEADSPFRMLEPDQIREMAAGGLVEFGAHTRTHAILRGLSAERLREEIEGSLDDVRKLTGKPCRTFAYPNGRACDYDARATDILRGRGVAAAVTTIGGPNGKTTDPLELRRYGIGAQMPWRDFKLEIHHVKSALRRAA